MFDLFSKLKIGAKISAILLVVVLVSVLTESFFAYQQSKNTIEEDKLQSLNRIADTEVKKLQTFINEINAAVQIGQDLKPIKDFLKGSANGGNAKKDEIGSIDFSGDDLQLDTPDVKKDTKPDDTNNITKPTQPEKQTITFDAELENAVTTIQFAYKLNNVYIVDKDKKVRYISRETPEQTRGEEFKLPAVDPSVLVKGRDTVYFSKVTLQQLGKEKKIVFLVAAPIRDELEGTGKEVLGQLIYEVDMARVEQLIADKAGLGSTGQVWLLQDQEKRFVYLNSFTNKKQKISPLDNAGNKDDPSTPKIVLRSLKKEQKHNEAIDENDYLAVSRFVPGVEWGIIVKNDKAEIYAPAQALLNRFLIAGVFVIIASLIIGILFSQLLTRPLGNLQKTIDSLGRGELPPVLTSESQDEIGEMTNRINSLVENLNKTANFAQNIGNQRFDTEFTPVSKNDILGNALINARDSLVASAEANSKENWVVSRLAEVGDILRSTNQLSELADQVLAYVVKESGAIQGAFYVMKKDEAGTDFLDMIASYAYNKKKYLSAKFKFYKNKYAEGLVGQAAIEQDIIQRTEIPDEYVTISSGLLGDKKPKCLLITPLITNDTEVYGVIELAAFEEFGDREVAFIKRISEITARTIFNINVNENTRKLLEEQQKLSQELQANEGILRKNAEELENKNLEIQKTNEELERQYLNVQNEQRKIQALLENASEVITIYNSDGKIRFISPSVTKILGYEPEELIGKTDMEHIEGQGKEVFQKMFEDLLQFPDEKMSPIQFSYKTQDGDSIWLEATGTNLLDDPAIEGIVINTRDITERRRAEKEERMRGQMQALSENSADLILRMNREGLVYYINPTIESLTGHNPHKFLQKSIDAELVPQSVLNKWFKLVEKSFRLGEKSSDVVEFETIEGKKIMSVNAIPERNDEGGTETFLLVSHDITDREADKERIAVANKKITDSINYAKRIQGSILPDSTWMQAVFPDSFVMFKPKDIVSGDFPWMLRTEKHVYIAVVDCTGHGVPGALISLIGYFLLSNIFSTEQNLNLTPGEVLDLLDEAVVRTLRQTEEDSVSKDGMDVSLCKIDIPNQILEYAGAHRPLYYMDIHKPETEEVLDEIKGDKMPVGGGQYKNRGAFATHKREYKQGDMVLMFSDGLPDQFGGPDNRKFSPKRIRDILKNNVNTPMMGVNDAIENELKVWMKFDGRDYVIKQTDDILVIGIRF